MEKHLIYKKEVGGSNTSCPNIHMEWRWSIFGDKYSFHHRQWAYGDIFWPSPKHEMVKVNEFHHIYASLVMVIKVISP